MKTALTLTACVALLAGCDYLDGALDEAEEALDETFEPTPPPAVFSSLIITDAPLPRDEDGTGPDLYVEVQDASGAPVYRAPSVLIDAEATSLPYALGGGEVVGTTRSYFVVLMDRDDDGYDFIAATDGFSADDLRASPSDTFAVTDRRGRLHAELVLDR
jgi:hypothetical protein